MEEAMPALPLEWAAAAWLLKMMLAVVLLLLLLLLVAVTMLAEAVQRMRASQKKG